MPLRRPFLCHEMESFSLNSRIKNRASMRLTWAIKSQLPKYTREYAK